MKPKGLKPIKDYYAINNPSMYEVIEKYYEFKVAIEEELKTLEEFYRPLVTEAKKNGDVEALEQLANDFPNTHFKALIYKAMSELVNDV